MKYKIMNGRMVNIMKMKIYIITKVIDSSADMNSIFMIALKQSP
jgi:hypothetical protein